MSFDKNQLIEILQQNGKPVKIQGSEQEITTICPYCRAAKGNPNRHTLYIHPTLKLHGVTGWVYCHRCQYTNTVVNFFNEEFDEQLEYNSEDENENTQLNKENQNEYKKIQFNFEKYNILKKYLYSSNYNLLAKEYIEKRGLNFNWFMDTFKDTIIIYNIPSIIHNKNWYIYNKIKNTKEFKDYEDKVLKDFLKQTYNSIILFSNNYVTFTSRKYKEKPFEISKYIPYIKSNDLFILEKEKKYDKQYYLFIVEGQFDGYKLYWLLQQSFDYNFKILILNGKNKLKTNLKKLFNVSINKEKYIINIKLNKPLIKKVIYYLDKDNSLQDINKVSNILKQFIPNNLIKLKQSLKYKDIGDCPSVEEFHSSYKEIYKKGTMVNQIDILINNLEGLI